MDQGNIEITGAGRGFLNGPLRYLVEYHPVNRNLRLEHLEEVPRNSLTFAVLIRCEIQFVDALEELLEVVDLFPRTFGDDVDRCEPVVHVDPEPCRFPQIPLRWREFGCPCRDVTDVPDG